MGTSILQPIAKTMLPVAHSTPSVTVILQPTPSPGPFISSGVLWAVGLCDTLSSELTLLYRKHTSLARLHPRRACYSQGSSDSFLSATSPKMTNRV